MTVHLYDAMCVVRRALETDPLGRAPRRLLTQVLNPADVHIWCWDAPGSRATRRAIFPAYKTTRKPHPDNIWPMIGLIKEGLRHTCAIQVECPGFEADDIIGTLCRTYPWVKKHIHSTDRDLGQLLNADTTADFTSKIPPEWVRLYKTCVGDPSDDVPGIKGFGEKTWGDMTDEHKRLLQEAVVCMRNAPPFGDHFHMLLYRGGWENLPQRCQTWIAENPGQLTAMWEIVDLFTVPAEQLSKGTIAGQLNVAAVDALLRKYKH